MKNPRTFLQTKRPDLLLALRRHVNSLREALLPLRLVGFRNGLRAARYAVERDRLDAGYGTAGQNGVPVRPGRLLGAEAIPYGARFCFEQYELNVRFLAPNLVRIVWGTRRPRHMRR